MPYIISYRFTSLHAQLHVNMQVCFKFIETYFHYAFPIAGIANTYNISQHTSSFINLSRLINIYISCHTYSYILLFIPTILHSFKMLSIVFICQLIGLPRIRTPSISPNFTNISIDNHFKCLNNNFTITYYSYINLFLTRSLFVTSHAES